MMSSTTFDELAIATDMSVEAHQSDSFDLPQVGDLYQFLKKSWPMAIGSDIFALIKAMQLVVPQVPPHRTQTCCGVHRRPTFRSPREGTRGEMCVEMPVEDQDMQNGDV